TPPVGDRGAVPTHRPPEPAARRWLIPARPRRQLRSASGRRARRVRSPARLSWSRGRSCSPSRWCSRPPSRPPPAPCGTPRPGWETVKVLARTAVLAGVAVPPVRTIAMRIVQQGHPDLTSVLGTVGHEGMTLLRNTALAGLLLAILDYGLQRRRVGRQLRMTK